MSRDAFRTEVEDDLTEEDQNPLDELRKSLNSSMMQRVLNATPRNDRAGIATQALWTTSTARAWNTAIESADRPYSCPPTLRNDYAPTHIEHEKLSVPDPVTSPIRSPKRYYARPEPWQAHSTAFEKLMIVPATPISVKEAGTRELEFCPSGTVKGKVPGYAGHFTSSLRDTLRNFRELNEPTPTPYPPIEGTMNHGNVPGYSGYIPTSLFNSQYSRHARAHTPGETTTATVHTPLPMDRHATTTRFARTNSLGATVTLTYPFNPFNSKIGSAVTGTVYQDYSRMRFIHPRVGASGV